MLTETRTGASQCNIHTQLPETNLDSHPSKDQQIARAPAHRWQTTIPACLTAYWHTCLIHVQNYHKHNKMSIINNNSKGSATSPSNKDCVSKALDNIQYRELTTR